MKATTIKETIIELIIEIRTTTENNLRKLEAITVQLSEKMQELEKALAEYKAKNDSILSEICSK